MGYFQLLNNVDLVVLADEYEYSKGGWINRNRLIINKKINYVSIPLESAPDFLKINERQISNTFDPYKILKSCSASYTSSRNFSRGNELMEKIFLDTNRNLFGFILNSINKICNYLDIKTKIVSLSEISNSKELRYQDRIIDICKTLGASSYLNPEGGKDLYSREDFKKHGLDLEFLEHLPLPYNQFLDEFVPKLSILDLIYMMDSEEELQLHLKSCQVVKA